MSKMSTINLEAQEEVETLGYSTVGEAIADGWDSAEWMATREQEKAHQAWLNKKETIINKLEMLAADTEYQIYKDTIQEAIDFIKEVKYE